jgi:membrane fusion protein, multidrug efflux system
MRKNLISAALVALALLLWLLSGVLLNQEEAVVHPTLAEAGDTAAPESAQALARVRARIIEAQPRTRAVVLRGRTQSKRVVEVKAEVAGRVVSRPVERGQQVKSGELLCQLAVDDREASVVQAEAAFEEARIEHEGSLKLKQQGLQSETAIAKAAARLEAARADVHRKGLNLERISIVAPYDGFIETLHMNEGDYAAAGSVCVTLIDLDPMLIAANVTEAEVDKMQLQGVVKGRTSTGQEVVGVLTFIGRQSDPQTRTYPVEITVANPDFSLRSGLTATVELELEQVSAHLVSPALFALDDAGDIGLRTIGTDNRVEFHRITIIDDGVDGVWVSGLPDPVHLITVGQEFVHAGQLVDPIYSQPFAQ